MKGRSHARLLFALARQAKDLVDAPHGVGRATGERIESGSVTGRVVWLVDAAAYERLQALLWAIEMHPADPAPALGVWLADGGYIDQELGAEFRRALAEEERESISSVAVSCDAAGEE